MNFGTSIFKRRVASVVTLRREVYIVDIMLVIMFIIYIVLLVIASRKKLFDFPTPADTSTINIDDVMKDRDATMLALGRDQFEKFKEALSRTSNASVAFVAAAMVDAIFMLLGAWNNFGKNVTLLCVIGVVVGFMFYKVSRDKRKKQIFVKGRDLFKMQTGYILDTYSSSQDYVYKTASGGVKKGTANFHKVLVGIIGKEGKPEAYLVDMDHFTFERVMKSEMCDVVTYNGNFVIACYLVQKEPRK